MKFRNILLMSVPVLFCAASLSATTLEHTWVSRSGNDNNNCSATAPCLTFQNALTSTAAGGLITAMDAGDFGPVSITQSVTIDGNNLGSVTFNGVSGIYIGAGANVALQNLTINGLGAGEIGIDDLSGGTVNVDNCKITNFTNTGIYFGGTGNLTVENSRVEFFIGIFGVHGIEIGSSGAVQNVLIKNTLIDAAPISNPNDGFVIDTGAGPVMATLQNVTIKGAGYEAVLAQSGVTQITNSVLAQSSTGVYASGGAIISVTNSLITSNSTGVCSNSSSKIRLDNNDIYDNITAIKNCGGIVKTSSTNKTSGAITIPASDVSDSVTF